MAEGRLWTEAETATLLQMRADGCSRAQVAAALGRTQDSCLSRVKKVSLDAQYRIESLARGVEPRDRQRSWSRDEVATLLRLRDVESRTFTAIGLVVGRSGRCCSFKYRKLRPHAVNPMRPWSSDDLAALQRLREVDGLTWSAIGRLLGRNLSSCHGRYHCMRRLVVEPKRERVPAPAAVFAERAARQALQHRDFTSEFFGDPLPGRSALDQRRASPC